MAMWRMAMERRWGLRWGTERPWEGMEGDTVHRWEATDMEEDTEHPWAGWAWEEAWEAWGDDDREWEMQARQHWVLAEVC